MGKPGPSRCCVASDTSSIRRRESGWPSTAAGLRHVDPFVTHLGSAGPGQALDLRRERLDDRGQQLGQSHLVRDVHDRCQSVGVARVDDACRDSSTRMGHSLRRSLLAVDVGRSEPEGTHD